MLIQVEDDALTLDVHAMLDEIVADADLTAVERTAILVRFHRIAVAASSSGALSLPLAVGFDDRCLWGNDLVELTSIEQGTDALGVAEGAQKPHQGFRLKVLLGGLGRD